MDTLSDILALIAILAETVPGIEAVFAPFHVCPENMKIFLSMFGISTFYDCEHIDLSNISSWYDQDHSDYHSSHVTKVIVLALKHFGKTMRSFVLPEIRFESEELIEIFEQFKICTQWYGMLKARLSRFKHFSFKK